MRLRPITLALFWLLLCLAAAALEPFEESLDAFEFEKALAQIRQLPDGPRRNLALAQHAVLRERADRSFAFTDRIDPATLSPDLMAEYLLVRAYQEKASEALDSPARWNRLERMLAEGLRQPCLSPRLRARLLLLRIEEADPNALDDARTWSKELSEMRAINPRFALTAMALVETKAQNWGAAQSLWAAQGQLATAAKERRAAGLFHLRRCRPLNRLGRKEEASALLTEVLEGALDSGDAVVALSAFQLIDGMGVDRARVDEVLWGSLDRMPPSFEKLLLMMRLDGDLSRPGSSGLLIQGQQLAARLGEPLVEAGFWLRLARREKDPTMAAKAWARGQELLAACDVRGQGASRYYPTIVSSKGMSLNASSPSPRFSEESLQRTVSEAKTTAEKLLAYRRAVLKGLTEGQPDLAQLAMVGLLTDVASLPPEQRFEPVENLKDALVLGLWPNLSPTSDPLDLRVAGARSLLHKLRQRPDLVATLIDAYLLQMKREVDPVARRNQRRSLAVWLSGLGREEEAEELFGPLPDAPSLQAPYLHARGQAKLWLGDPAALDFIWKRDALAEPWWRNSLGFGWRALEQGRSDLAQGWLQMALEHCRPHEAELLRTCGPQALQALIWERQGQVERALAHLKEGESGDPSSAKEPWRYKMPRAEILLRAGRWEEATLEIDSLPEPSTPGEAFRQLQLRRELAGARGLKGERDRLQQQLLDAYRGAVSGLGDPVFAHFYGLQMAPHLGLEAPSLPSTSGPAMTLGGLVERLELLRRREPDNEALRRLSAADLKALSLQAQADELFVQPVLIRESVVLIVLANDRVQLREVFCDRARLDVNLANLTSAVSDPASSQKMLQDSAAYLSRWLVAPWRELSPDKRRVRWLGEGPLRQVPLSVLSDLSGSPLLETAEVSYLDGPGRHRLSFAAADPALLLGGSDNLQGAATELRLIRSFFPRGGAWALGEPTSRLSKLASEARLIHVASHGLSPSDQRLAGTLRGDNGDLSAFELADLRLQRGTLAVVGACYSGEDGRSGRDNSSLASGLRTAGADVVIAAQWELDDQVSQQLFETFYHSLRSGSTPETALHRAQREVRRTLPHPFYWAGLQLLTGP